MSHEPPRFPMPEAKANPTAVPAKGRAEDDDTDEEDGNALVRALRKVLGFANQTDPRTAAVWLVLGFAVASGGWIATSHWTHQQWGWGPCPHRQHLDLLRSFNPELFKHETKEEAPVPQPAGRPPVIAPAGGGR